MSEDVCFCGVACASVGVAASYRKGTWFLWTALTGSAARSVRSYIQQTRNGVPMVSAYALIVFLC